MATAYDSDLAKKLNIRSGMSVRVIAQPADVDLSGLSTTPNVDGDGILVFVTTLADVEARSQHIIDAAASGQITWMAYPKAKQLGTDLNRDILWRYMLEKEVEAVRQVAIDEIWSAMRFRKAG